LKKYLAPEKPEETPDIEDDGFDWEKELEIQKGAKTEKTSERNPDLEPDSQELEVQRIIDIRKNGGVIEYLIQWKGFSAEANTWEPIENLNCEKLLKEFHRQKGTECQQCDFRALSLNGLKSHMMRHDRARKK
jgi:hypothetical protein